MKASVKRYVRERDEMLKKRSVSELRKFVAEHKDILGAEYVAAFSKASDEFIEIVLHKMICNAIKLPAEMRRDSAIWLMMRNLTPEIGGG